MKIVSKIHQKSIKHQWKWGTWGRPGATLGVFGLMLVESDEFGPHFGRDFFHFFAPRWVLDEFWGGFGGQVGAKLGPSWGQVGIKIDKKRCQKKNEKKIASWRHLGANLAPSWPPKNSQNGAKLGAKSIQVWCWFESCFWKDFGIIFSSILYTT